MREGFYDYLKYIKIGVELLRDLIFMQYIKGGRVFICPKRIKTNHRLKA